MRIFNQICLLLPKSKVKLSLLFSFTFLLIFQFINGFKYFDDYMLIFIFILFLNDQFVKLKTTITTKPSENEDRKTRTIMTILFLLLLIIPSVFNVFHFSIQKQVILYKLGFIIWAQIFLVDAFYHYKETQSKKWLLFANTAMLMIVIGAFIV